MWARLPMLSTVIFRVNLCTPPLVLASVTPKLWLTMSGRSAL